VVIVEPRTQVDYFDVALDLLAEGGASALTIANLCDRLQVTKGSFYYHFASQPAFYAAFLEHWELGRAYQLREQVDAVDDPLARIELLKRLGVAVHHEAESAIRAWARTNPVVAASQQRVDEAREVQLALAFVEAGIDPDHARVLARIGLTILVGTQQIEERVDRVRLTALFDEYQRWLVASARLPSQT
jgi:AcrR family transcriptional regulator